MKIKDIIKLEEKLLELDVSGKKFSLTFHQNLELRKYLRYIGEITDEYFILIAEYDKYLQKQNLTQNDYEQKFNDYNNKLLNTNIKISRPQKINKILAV